MPRCDLKAAGADVIQLDEPWLQARPEEARRLALPAIDAALESIPGSTPVTLPTRYTRFQSAPVSRLTQALVDDRGTRSIIFSPRLGG